VRTYAQLLAQENKKLFRILMLIFCLGEMLALSIRFSDHWSRMESSGHWTAIEYLLPYPLIAVAALKKNANPIIVAFMAYSLMALLIPSLKLW